MTPRSMLRMAAAAAAAIALGQVAAFSDGPAGPDIVVVDLPGVMRWTTDAVETTYSVGTRACNAGDVPADWIVVPSNLHPVIAQNMYRLDRDGRFEQIGQSWVKHGFCAVQTSILTCGTCLFEEGCIDHLNPGCTDAYSAANNGIQGLLGPKYQINGFTGEFPIPYDEGEGTGGNRRRIRVANDDLDPGLNVDARYFIEAHYVALDDSLAGNRDNNTAYRQIAIDEKTFDPTFVTATTMDSAIRAWATLDPLVTLAEVRVPDEGLFLFGYRVDLIGVETWAYEYVIYNMNSDRSASALTVPFESEVSITNLGFHDIDYHSGDIWDGTDWSMSASNGEVRFETETFAANPNANAVRWGTLYNFRFVANAPPQPALATIELFKPGTPMSLTVPVVAPFPNGPCAADFDDDGVIGFLDLLALLSKWGLCVGCAEDIDGDGSVGFLDLLVVLAGWGACG